MFLIYYIMIGEICISLYILYTCTFCCIVGRDLINEYRENNASINNSINNSEDEGISLYPNLITSSNIRISQLFDEIKENE